MRKTVIYALIDPTSHEVRYVGKTNASPRIRFTSHMRDKRPSWKRNWIQSLAVIGMEPRIEVLEEMNEGSNKPEWQEAERFWISYLRSLGARLTNLTDGGEGLHGLVFTPEHKKKIGDAHRGRKRSPETCARMAESRKKMSNEHLIRLAESQRGNPLKPEHRAKLGKAWIGKRHTQETKRKMSLASSGRRASAEARLNMSLAQKNRSPEHQEKLAASKRGKPLSAEHCARLSEAQRGRKHSAETIAKMRESARKRWL